MGRAGLLFLLLAVIVGLCLAGTSRQAQTTVKCPYPKCRKPVAKTATSCKHCKKKFVTCQKCKRPNAVDSKFCIYGCGKLSNPVEMILVEVCSETDSRANEYCPSRRQQSIEKNFNLSICAKHRKVETITVNICPDSNLVAQEFCTSQTPRNFISGQQPRDFCQLHVEAAVRRISDIGVTAYSPMFGPSGRIVFAAHGAMTSMWAQIFTSNSKGQDIERLTNTSSNCVSPYWLNDGRIFYSEYKKDTFEWQRMVFDQTMQKSDPWLHCNSQSNYKYFNFELSKMGKLLFTGDHDGQSEIYVSDGIGLNERRLTTNFSKDYDPRWGPNGKIVFVSERDGRPQLYSMAEDGSNQVNLSRNAFIEDSPSVGPDGRIAFRSTRLGRKGIFLLDLDNSKVLCLTNTGPVNESPSWGPNGLIVFCSTRDGNFGIYTLQAPPKK